MTKARLANPDSHAPAGFGTPDFSMIGSNASKAEPQQDRLFAYLKGVLIGR
jgi:hypothetical protein